MQELRELVYELTKAKEDAAAALNKIRAKERQGL